MTAVELNKIAGFTINPLYTGGVAILPSAGKRVTTFVLPAVKSALIGILVRGIIHLIIFKVHMGDAYFL
jgi:hypothetical protein